MPDRQLPLFMSPVLQMLRVWAAWLRPVRRFDASYHNTFRPTFMRGAITYQRSHSRSRIRFLWNCPKCPRALFKPAAVHGIPVLPLQPKDISARSKWVPTKIEFGVVAEPVKNPFGLHRYRSWAIKKLCAFFFPLMPSRSSLCSNEPITRKV